MRQRLRQRARAPADYSDIRAKRSASCRVYCDENGCRDGPKAIFGKTPNRTEISDWAGV